MPYTDFMRGRQYIKRIKRIGRKGDVDVWIVRNRGKGSHQMLHYGDRKTTIKNPREEWSPTYYRLICVQLGIDEMES